MALMPPPETPCALKQFSFISLELNANPDRNVIKDDKKINEKSRENAGRTKKEGRSKLESRQRSEQNKSIENQTELRPNRASLLGTKSR